MPGLYVITGSNGAGKSSFGSIYLPEFIQSRFEVFDGDKLFLQKRKELYPRVMPSLKEAKVAAGEWLIDTFKKRVQDALDHREHFVYEGHFVEEETWDVPRRFLSAGYEFHLIFLGLVDTERSGLRVMDRAIHGGHNVPIPEIEKNFYGNLRKLNEHFRLIDELQIIDTSNDVHPVPLCSLKKGQVILSAPTSKLPLWFTSGLPEINKLLT